jgi:PAS domain S-box-containing protein
MRRLTLILALALLVVELAVTAAVVLTSDDVSYPWLKLVFGGAAGTAFVVSGLLAINRRPNNRVGLYLLATGYLWFLAALGDSNVDWIATTGYVLGGLVWVPFTALVLAYPSGRLETRLERVLPIVTGVALTTTAVIATIVDSKPAEADGGAADSGLAVTDTPSGGETFDRTAALVGIVLVGLIVIALTRRWRHATPALRWQLWPVAGAGVAALVAIAVVVVADQISADAAEALRILFFAAFAAVPVAFLLGLLRVRLARSSANDLLFAIQRGTPLREALAYALGDPAIEVAYPLGAGNVWVDSQGRAVPEPVPDAGRAVRDVSRDGERIAALRYDAALDAERELLDAVAGAAGIALQNERLQAELRAELEYMSTVTNTAPSLLVTIGADGRVNTINRAALEAAGYTENEDVRGRFYWDLFIDPREHEAMTARFHALAPDFPPGEYENTFEDARGELRTIYWRTAPVRDAAGTVVSIVSGGIDITMRRRRELELERERDVQTRVFESMPSMIVALALDGTIRDRDADNPQVGANRAFRDAIRWPDEELVGRDFLDLVVDDPDGQAARALESAASGTTSEQVESQLRSKDGTARTFAWFAFPIADVTGRMERLILICGADITERTRLEAEKEREREFLNAIANTAPSLLCLIDADGRLLDNAANIAFEQTLGYEPTEIGGQILWKDFVDPSEADDVRAVVEGVAAGALEPREQDNTWVTKTGELHSMAWTCTPLPALDERTLFLITAVDITERKRSAEELRASRARLVRAEEMARRALERNLHDGAQQRLVALSVALRLVEARMTTEPSAAQELLAGAQVELTHALEELRELARGIHPAVLTDRGLKAALETLATRSPLPVEIETPSEPLHPDVEAAAYYVVAESLTNVAKYAHASSAAVRVQRNGRALTVCVSDDGVGGADPSGGSGLRGLVDRVAVLDGTLTVESEHGHGTTIRAEIPLVE